MSSTAFEIDDPDGSVRIAGIAGAPDATAGQVLTADGSGFAAWADIGTGSVTVADIDAESSTAGQVITSNGDGTASWATPAGGNGVLHGQLDVGALDLYMDTPLDSTSNSHMTVQGPPLVVAAMGVVCNVPVVAPGDVPNISDEIDCNATLYVTDLTGTNTLTVSAGNSQATPVVGTGTPIDWTGTSATIVGADLAWSDTTGVSSTAGGVYSCTVLASAAPD